MEKDIVDGKIGSIGAYDVEFKEGKLCAKVDFDFEGGLFTAGVGVKLDGGKVLDAIAKAIPGTVDDAIFVVMKSALLGK